MGEIQGAQGFGRRTLYCRWQLLHDGAAWALVNGRAEGCTQVSGPEQPEDRLTVWAHPLDLQLSTHSIQVGRQRLRGWQDGWQDGGDCAAQPRASAGAASQTAPAVRLQPAQHNHR
jgi:hypothetical protein